MRISAIVDGCFSLIVDGETASPGWRWGSAQALGWNVAQSSTTSLKRAAVALALGPVLGVSLTSWSEAPAGPPEAPRPGMHSCPVEPG